MSRKPTTAAFELMETMRPKPQSHMNDAAAAQQTRTPVRLTRSVWSQASDPSPGLFSRTYTPATFTRMLGCQDGADIAARTAASSATSATTDSAAPPAAVIRSTTSSAGAESRIRTKAPSSASRAATADPIPPAPPVTTAVLPAMPRTGSPRSAGERPGVEVLGEPCDLPSAHLDHRGEREVETAVGVDQACREEAVAEGDVALLQKVRDRDPAVRQGRHCGPALLTDRLPADDRPVLQGILEHAVVREQVRKRVRVAPLPRRERGGQRLRRRHQLSPGDRTAAVCLGSPRPPRAFRMPERRRLPSRRG